MNNRKPKDVEEYLDLVPEPAQSTLRKVREVIQSVVPEGTTEIISYGMPTFKYGKALVGYAAFSDHCSFFPYNSSLITQFKDDLKNFQTAKGTIRFPTDKPLPTPLLKKLVKARVAENKLEAKF